jgi:hypothetical protein
MATVDESTALPPQIYHRRTHLQPLSPRVPSSTDRHFEQYLIDHHHYSKLPSIAKQKTRQSIENSFIQDKNFLSYRQLDIPSDFEHHNNSINRLLNNEQYRRGQARLVEYRQHSRIPGIKLSPTNNSNEISSNELILPLKEVFIDTTRTKQQHQNRDDIDLVSDDSIKSNEGDRRRRAKHWIKEHQFFFTEYQ